MSEFRYPEPLGGKYEFEAGVNVGNGWGDEPTYIVQLPHQCGEWVVMVEPDKAKAIADMELFVAEAQVALEKLREA